LFITDFRIIDCINNVVYPFMVAFIQVHLITSFTLMLVAGVKTINVLFNVNRLPYDYDDIPLPDR